MRKLTTSVVTGLAGVAVAAAAIQQPAVAAPVQHDGATAGQAKAAAHRPDNRPGPVTKKQLALREAAVQKVAAGKATPNADGVVKLGDDKFAEVETTKQDEIFTILAEFGTRAPASTAPRRARCTTRSREPDRTKDNSTTWTADYNKAYYENLFNGSGESMKSYYEALSNGQYSVTNEVQDWVQVPYNESYYGDNAIEDFGGTWAFIEDAGDAWYQAQLDAGKTPAEIDAYLSQFDVWDRNDYDNDGNFDEADGYIDHFQAVHAGQGEDAGGGAQGEDAIWSHRWYVNGDDYGQTGPTVGDRAEQGRRRADRRVEVLVRRLHDRAGERRPRCVRARVRPRPRPAGLLRHRRRRERHRVLDPDELRLVAGPRCRGQRGHRHHAGPDGAGGEALPRLARLQRGQRRPVRQLHAEPGAVPPGPQGPGGQDQPAGQDRGDGLHDADVGHPRLVDRLRRRPERVADDLGPGARRGSPSRPTPGTTSRPDTTTCTPSGGPLAGTGSASETRSTARRATSGRRCATPTTRAARPRSSGSATRPTAGCTCRARSSTTSASTAPSTTSSRVRAPGRQPGCGRSTTAP